MGRFGTLILVFCGVLGASLGSRILAVNLVPSASHGILMERLVRNLGEKGHHVTYVTSTPPTKPCPNLDLIHIPGTRDALFAQLGLNNNNNQSSSLLKMRKLNPWLTILFMGKMASGMLEHVFKNPGVKKLIASEDKFDLVLGEIMSDEAVLAGFSYRFQAPLVALCPTVPTLWANSLVGNPAPSAFIPDIFLGYSDKMTFLERTHNFLFGIVMELNHYLRYLPLHDSFMRESFGNDLPYIVDILKNTSLVLVNHHHALGFSRPYVPNMVEVAGVHINPPKELPKDLKSFMDNSKNGVILFSMGSNVNSSDLPKEQVSSILTGLGKLKQNVLWKFEAKLENIPKNVKIMKWIPQTDVLAHPNLKLFITHGGLLSTTESLSIGVPVIGVPVAGDQHTNMKQVEKAGWGIMLELDDLNEHTIQEAVETIISDPRYKETAVEKSAIFNDNPMKPLESSIWWIEYVLRHGGAAHLRSAAQDLAWYQVYLLDVYALATVTLFAILYVNLCVARCVLRKLFCRNATIPTSTDKKKKN